MRVLRRLVAPAIEVHKTINFDHPTANEWDLMLHHIRKLKIEQDMTHSFFISRFPFFITFVLSYVKKMFLAILGVVSLVLGIIGIFLPVLPTTPFLLLSTALFARSSPKLHEWLINHRLLGRYIRRFREDRSIPLKGKIISISMLWAFMLFSIFFVVSHKWYLQLLLAAVACAVTIHILSFKTRKRDK